MLEHSTSTVIYCYHHMLLHVITCYNTTRPTSDPPQLQGVVCLGVEVKGLQDAVCPAMGALGEHEGVGPPGARRPPRPPQHPVQSPPPRGQDPPLTGQQGQQAQQGDGEREQPHLEREWRSVR